MAPKFPLSRGCSERELNPSILVQDVGRDDLDLGNVWSERGPRATSRWRVSYPYKNVTKPTTWSSRFTSLSSNLRCAGAALTTRAKKIHVPESTRWAISRLRKSTVEPSSPQECPLPRAASMPAQRLSSESDADHFGDLGDPEDDDDDSDEDVLEDTKPPKLHPSRSWTQGCM
ncbi:G patch domain-containing protein 1 [Phytophthora cinnamomi]|uniref:G patch domain-containing protein 1 n=1 Tax=Phytophthora cinnamomi TaxID=4785 RepID=UPI00355A5D2B|nr:G patch domain-containing protein 1 [Phytophthora cinnamomi]